jgi:hypothetical protein
MPGEAQALGRGGKRLFFFTTIANGWVALAVVQSHDPAKAAQAQAFHIRLLVFFLAGH